MSPAGSADRSPGAGPGSGPDQGAVPAQPGAEPPAGGRRRPVPADLLTIGEVLAELQGEFADVSHSKIRFLEDRGLVSPARTPSGYRKFARRDVERLRLVLSLQRDHYLPLRVIGEHVAALDAGHAPPRLPGAGHEEDLAQAAAAPGPGAGAPVRLSRTEAVARAGGDAALVDGLESHGLLPRPGAGGYPAEAAAVVEAARQLGAYGIEPRHLRALRAAAEKEAALVEQVVTPLRRTQRADSRGGAGGAGDRAAEVTAELAETLLRLHGALLRTALDAGGA